MKFMKRLVYKINCIGMVNNHIAMEEIAIFSIAIL